MRLASSELSFDGKARRILIHRLWSPVLRRKGRRRARKRQDRRDRRAAAELRPSAALSSECGYPLFSGKPVRRRRSNAEGNIATTRRDISTSESLIVRPHIVSESSEVDTRCVIVNKRCDLTILPTDV